MIVLDMLRTHEHVDIVETMFRLTNKGEFYIRPRGEPLWMPICTSSSDGQAFTFSRGSMRPAKVSLSGYHETDPAVWETELPVLRVHTECGQRHLYLSDYGFCYQGQVLPRWQTQMEERLAIGTQFTFRQDSGVTHLFAHAGIEPFWATQPVATLKPWWQELFDRLGKAKLAKFTFPVFAPAAT